MVHSHDIDYAEQVEEDLETVMSVVSESTGALQGAKSYQGESDAKVIEPQSMDQCDPPIDTVENQDGSQHRTNDGRNDEVKSPTTQA